MSTITPVSPNPLMAIANEDLLAELLAQKRSPETRHAYGKDIRDFFRRIANTEATPEMVTYFLQLDQKSAVALVLRYKGMMLEVGLKEATINRRLAALKSLVKLARLAGRCSYSLDEVKGEKVRVYQDTTGISKDVYRKVLGMPNRNEIRGKRDYALLRLLWDNALRRGEVSKANIGDFDGEARRLKIRGKGKGSGFELVDLSVVTAEAIRDWLYARSELNLELPLFTSLDPVKKGHRLGGSGIYWIVQYYFKLAGVKKQMSPHRIRHSSITAALDATNGNVRKVQKLSRHSQIDTLMVYDDNRQQDQLAISELLANMV